MAELNAASLTPPEVVTELDRFIVGQHGAKRAVAIALRNRWRRQNVDPGLRDEITPKNIILIGPTGVGKTEIARRLAKLAQAPFVKVEASKFTEVGYVGRDVDSMVRDLMAVAVQLVKNEEFEKVQGRARGLAEQAPAEGRAWVQSFGPAPVEAGRREAWLRAVSTVAAFRDRWELGADPRPLGPESAVTTQEGLGHRRSAEAAIARALKLANGAAPPPAQGVVPAGPELVTEGGALL